MVAHSAPPHGPTFTWAPSCASQRPLGSAEAVPAQESAQSVTAAAAQSLGSFMARILPTCSARASPNLNLTEGLRAQKKPGTCVPGSPPQPLVKSAAEPIEAPDQFSRDEFCGLLRVQRHDRGGG